MRIALRCLLLLALAPVATTGCATAPALYDLVVPNPVAELSLERDAPSHTFRWYARYGREPQDFAHYPIHAWIGRDGAVEVPAGFEACMVSFARSQRSFRGGKEGTLDFAGRILLGNATTGPNYGPPNDYSREIAPLSRECVILVAPSGNDLRKIVTYHLDGRVLHEQTLPLDVPIIEPERWGALALAPVFDFVFTPVMVVGAAGYGVYAGGRWVVIELRDLGR
jgi:hypothetical protein